MQTIQHLSPRIAVIAALLAVSAGCTAQAQLPPQSAASAAPAATAATAAPPPPVTADAPPPGAPMPPPPAPPAPGAQPAPLADTASSATTQGTVSRFLINPDGDVDGFLTDDGTLVRFPPHMSAQLTAAVRKGDRVQLSGWRDQSGIFTAQRITDTRSGSQVIDQPPMPGAAPLPRAPGADGLARLSVQGQVARVTTAPRGEPDGVILADGTVIKLPPPVAQQYSTLVRTGATVSAQGYGTRNQYGTALQATAFGSPGNVTPLYQRNAPMP